MSNDGKSIGDHLRWTEEQVNRDSSSDSSASRNQERENSERVTNRAPAEPPRRERKDRQHAQ